MTNSWSKSRISDKQLARKRQALTGKARKVAKPTKGKTEFNEIRLYNAKVMGMQNYYCIATMVSIDCASLNKAVMTVF